MLINLLPLYSRLVDSNAMTGVSLHQQKTWDLLSDPQVDVVINTAVTGDGKSYAAFGAYPDGGIMALYPTNELVRDQQRQLQHYLGQGDVIQRDMIASHSKLIFQSEVEEEQSFLAKFQQQFAHNLLQEKLKN